MKEVEWTIKVVTIGPCDPELFHLAMHNHVGLKQLGNASSEFVQKVTVASYRTLPKPKAAKVKAEVGA